MAPDDASAPEPASPSTTTTAPAPASSSGPDPAAAAWLGQLQEAAGVAPGEKSPSPAPPSKPATPKPPPAAAAPVKPADAKAAAPEEPKKPTVDEVNAKSMSRRQAARLAANEQVKSLKAERDTLRQIIAEALEGGDEATAGAPGKAGKPGVLPPADKDPKPDFYSDPEKWHEWNAREMQRQLAAAVEPLRAEQEARQRLEAEQQEGQRRAEERRAEMQQLEDDYAQSDEGEGWHDRVEVFKEAMSLGVQELIPGVPEQLGALLISRRVHEAITIANETGLNPAFVLDRLFAVNELATRAIQAHRGAGRPASASAAAAAPVAAQPVAPAAPRRTTVPPAAKSEVAGMRAAAAAPEAHSLGDQTSTSSGGGDEIEGLAQSGRLNANNLRSALARRGMSGAAMRKGALDAIERLENQRG